MVSLAGPRERDPLIAEADRAGDPAGDLIACRLAPRVGDAVRLPRQVDLDIRRLAALAAKRRRLVLVRIGGAAQGDAEALERLLAKLLGVEGIGIDRLGVVVGVRKWRPGIDHDYRRPPGTADRRGVEHCTLVGEPAQADVDAECLVVADRVEVPRLVPQRLGAGWVATLVLRLRTQRDR